MAYVAYLFALIGLAQVKWYGISFNFFFVGDCVCVTFTSLVFALLYLSFCYMYVFFFAFRLYHFHFKHLIDGG